MGKMSDVVIKSDEMFEAWWKGDQRRRFFAPHNKKLAKLTWDAAFDAGLMVGIDTMIARKVELFEKLKRLDI